MKKKNRLDRIYHGMMQRCLNPNTRNFPDYGGRGITVYVPWIRDKEAFFQWALANGYADNLTIERIDVDKGYNPENCRWATMQEQGLNKRNTPRLIIGEETKTLSEWCKDFGVDYSITYKRIFMQGWKVEDALNPQYDRKKKKKPIVVDLLTPDEKRRKIQECKDYLDEHLVFFDPGPSKKTRADRIKELQAELNEKLSFFEVTPYAAKLGKLVNAA